MQLDKIKGEKYKVNIKYGCHFTKFILKQFKMNSDNNTFLIELSFGYLYIFYCIIDYCYTIVKT